MAAGAVAINKHLRSALQLQLLLQLLCRNVSLLRVLKLMSGGAVCSSRRSPPPPPLRHLSPRFISAVFVVHVVNSWS